MSGPGSAARDGWTALERRAVVLPDDRLLYVPTPKVLSSAMLWLLAERHGHPADRLAASVLGPTPSTAVHDPVVHGLRTLGELVPQRREEALRSASWLRLGLTRDPFARLCSAWQHAVLLGAPGPLPVEPPPLVRVDDGGIDLGASFRRFVHLLDERWDGLTRNVHVVPQVEVLAPDLMGYTDLLPAEDPGAIEARLHAHVPGLGSLPRRNESLGIDHRRCYDDATIAIVARRYAADFARLGYATEVAVVDGPPLVLDALAGRVLDALHERNERIDLLRTGRHPRWLAARRADRLRRRARRRGAGT